MFFKNSSLIIFSETLDEATRSCESAVDIVEARIPAIMIPAINAASTPFLLSRVAIEMMIVSDLELASDADEADEKSGSSAPLSVIPIPTIPITIATAIEIMTQIVPTLLEILSLLTSPIAIKRTSM